MRRVLAVLVFVLALGGPAEAYRGMGAGHGPCWAVATVAEQQLMAKESRGWNTADNPASSAFGCGQLLHSMRVRYSPDGCDPATLNVACQMAAFRAYYTDRYGSAWAAVSNHRKKGTY